MVFSSNSRSPDQFFEDQGRLGTCLEVGPVGPIMLFILKLLMNLLKVLQPVPADLFSEHLVLADLLGPMCDQVHLVVHVVALDQHLGKAVY